MLIADEMQMNVASCELGGNTIRPATCVLRTPRREYDHRPPTPLGLNGRLRRDRGDAAAGAGDDTGADARVLVIDDPHPLVVGAATAMFRSVAGSRRAILPWRG